MQITSGVSDIFLCKYEQLLKSNTIKGMHFKDCKFDDDFEHPNKNHAIGFFMSIGANLIKKDRISLDEWSNLFYIIKMFACYLANINEGDGKRYTYKYYIHIYNHITGSIGLKRLFREANKRGEDTGWFNVFKAYRFDTAPSSPVFSFIYKYMGKKGLFEYAKESANGKVLEKLLNVFPFLKESFIDQYFGHDNRYEISTTEIARIFGNYPEKIYIDRAERIINKRKSGKQDIYVPVMQVNGFSEKTVTNALKCFLKAKDPIHTFRTNVLYAYPKSVRNVSSNDTTIVYWKVNALIHADITKNVINKLNPDQLVDFLEFVFESKRMPFSYKGVRQSVFKGKLELPTKEEYMAKVCVKLVSVANGSVIANRLKEQARCLDIFHQLKQGKVYSISALGNLINAECVSPYQNTVTIFPYKVIPSLYEWAYRNAGYSDNALTAARLFVSSINDCIYNSQCDIKISEESAKVITDSLNNCNSPYIQVVDDKVDVDGKDDE